MTNRVAFITGGSSGIGAAVAHALASDGHLVAVGYSHNAVAAGEIADKITAEGSAGRPVRIDVTDRASVDAAFAEIEGALGPVELLINAAGVVSRTRFVVQIQDADWDHVIDTNLTGTFRTVRRGLRTMIRTGFGRIVNISSVLGSTGSPGQAGYAASKAGLVGFTRSLASEVGSRSITANVVEPGAIATPMLEALPARRRGEVAAASSVRRIGEPAEIASLIGFLCSEKASYITGSVVRADGGLGVGR
jgi:3-oxoacyl-[acyl-carrier protein] reductase